ncbi:hypothetical protein AVHY2522_04070 [Acidovorax sp. SUPP2522]|nr:hypothetical protein AVHY2522_04070 [Acidovorax sp. SUPP2522]
MTLNELEAPAVEQMAERTASQPDIDPTTGAELGMGEDLDPVGDAGGLRNVR